MFTRNCSSFLLHLCSFIINFIPTENYSFFIRADLLSLLLQIMLSCYNFMMFFKSVFVDHRILCRLFFCRCFSLSVPWQDHSVVPISHFSVRCLLLVLFFFYTLLLRLFSVFDMPRWNLLLSLLWVCSAS